MLTIGKLGEAAGVKVPTIRYYEQIGLLPEPDRSAGNQRLYGQSALDRLRGSSVFRWTLSETF
jgi:DNA-binding transcriptional MerR regulator